MKCITLSAACLMVASVAATAQDSRQEKIQEEALNCAQQYNYNTNMRAWQDCLDKGLAQDSTIAYLWQQKAMPYFKCRKYEVGMGYLDKAVQYDRERWLPYRGFIKCIFQKNYAGSIADLEACIAEYGNGYVMDHTYAFYIAISQLQLNRFAEAEVLLRNYTEEQEAKRGKDRVHHLGLFYWGIAQFELGNIDEALKHFNEAIRLYPNFPDATYYRAICLKWQGAPAEEVEKVYHKALEDAKNGYTINEDNAFYETYPYQVRWPK
ncbi:Tetratricopeptide repeat protein [compost metagenome]